MGYHHAQYMKAKSKSNDKYKNYAEIKNLKQIYSQKYLKVVKYNYSLDESVQNFSSFESYIRIQDDELEIFNKKPLENPSYNHDQKGLETFTKTFKDEVFLLDDA